MYNTNHPTGSQPSNSYATTNSEKTQNITNDITDTNCNTAPSKRNGQHQCQTSPPRNNNTPNGTTNPHHTRPLHPAAKPQPYPHRPKRPPTSQGPTRQQSSTATQKSYQATHRNSNEDQHKNTHYNQPTRTHQPTSQTKETNTTTAETATQKQNATSRQTDHTINHNQRKKRPQETELTPHSTNLIQPTKTNKLANNDAFATQTEPTKPQQTPTRLKTSARPINQNKCNHKHTQTTPSFRAEHAPAKTTAKPDQEAHPTTRTINSVHPHQNQPQQTEQNTLRNPVKNNMPATNLSRGTIPNKLKFDSITDNASPHHDQVERNQPTGEANTHKQHPITHY